jgi:hypothetical protein
MKNNSLAILAIFVLSGVIVAGSTLATEQPILASSEPETAGEEEQGNTWCMERQCKSEK